MLRRWLPSAGELILDKYYWWIYLELACQSWKSLDYGNQCLIIPKLLFSPVLGNAYLTGLFSGIRNLPCLLGGSISVSFSRWIAAFSGRWGKDTRPLKTIGKCSVVESRDGEAGRHRPLRLSNQWLSVDSGGVCRASGGAQPSTVFGVTAETLPLNI